MKIWAIPLLPFAGMYGAILGLRNLAYDRGWKRSHALGVPVISVGNITVGGTGKTPMAEFLLAKLLEMGYRPAYLSRGYGRKTKGFRLVNHVVGDPAEYGDEAIQVASRFPEVPVAVCEDRVAGAKALLEQHQIDVLVLDDAFQHRRIQRDLDLVVVDVSRMPLQDWPLPAGRLREPLSGLGRAHVFILTKFKDTEEAQSASKALRKRFPRQITCIMALEPRAIRPFFTQNRQALEIASSPDSLGSQVADRSYQQLEATVLQGMPIIAFSGLGNNAFFKTTLETLGADVRTFLPFPDHHPYQSADIDKILQAFEAQKEIKGKLAPALILTTEKDYFRLKAMAWMEKHAHMPLHYLEVGMSPLEGWEMVEQKIKNITRNI